MTAKCFKCGKKYVPGQSNTKIYGPYMETTCPYCLHKWEGKILNYSEEQVTTYDHRLSTIQDAMKMQRFARFVELNSSDYYKRNKKNVKKQKESS